MKIAAHEHNVTKLIILKISNMLIRLNNKELYWHLNTILNQEVLSKGLIETGISV